MATVSRVLKGRAPVAEQTRAKVLQAVDELDYQPLRRTRQHRQSHGLVVDSLASGASRALVLGMQSDARGASPARSVLGCEGLRPREAVDDAVAEFAASCDGLVVAAAGPTDRFLAELAERMPVILVGRDPVAGCDRFDIDQAGPMLDLVTGLAALGRQRPVFIGDVSFDRALFGRYQGFQQGVTAAGLGPARSIEVPTDASGADQALPALLNKRDAADVAVCATDDLALRLLHVLVWRKVAVPTDLAVTGWGDEPGASYVVPRLTSVSDLLPEIGRLVSARLTERISNRGMALIDRTLRPEVVWRESTGRPGAGHNG